ncbi:MAG: glycosyltransferase family A protein [Aliarcobacter sp.]|nr:glycosyltransferase family A protein [Aliarcobacter sp.]
MIPTYNQKEYICEAINTALSQTYENIEVIVCDDNSTDNTYELIKSIKNKKLKIFKNCSNLGRIKNYQEYCM